MVGQDKETVHMISLKNLIRLCVNHWVMNYGSYFVAHTVVSKVAGLTFKGTLYRFVP